MTTHTQPSVAEIKRAVDDLGQAFEAFKEANDLRTKAKPGRGDVVLDQKVDRLSRDVSALQGNVDRLFVAAGRPSVTGGDPATTEHKAAFFDRFVRKGIETGLQALEAKALSTGSDADGGYAVPEALDGSIEKLLVEASPIRSVANVVQIGTSAYKKLVNLGGATSGWVGESDARAETDTPQFSEVAPPLGEIYANPAATQAMLDDAYFNVEDWLAEELTTEFAAQEGAAFVNGNGTNKPKGFLSLHGDRRSRRHAGLRLAAICPDRRRGRLAGEAIRPTSCSISSMRSGPAIEPRRRSSMNTNLVAEIRKFKDVRRQLSLAARPCRRPAGEPARLPRDRGGGHAGQGREFAFGRIRQFRARLYDHRSHGDPDPARSLHQQALRPFLRHQARRRRRGELGSDQAAEIRGKLTQSSEIGSRKPEF